MMISNIAIAILGISGVILTISLATIPNAFAEYIDCTKLQLSEACVGTTQSDRMLAGNTTDGNEGDDLITGGEGRICGGAGNDRIVGNDSTQFIVGDIDQSSYGSPKVCPSTTGPTGRDTILGGGSDDMIFHGNLALLDIPYSDNPDNKASDGSRDIIDCGAGNDIAVINVNVDHDVAVNCEQVFPG